MATRNRKIIRGRYPMPRFRTVEEESDFWDRHDPLDYGVWEEIPYDEFLKDCGVRSRRKVQLSLRVEPELIQGLKKVARRHKTKYQVLARELLWRNVRRLAQ